MGTCSAVVSADSGHTVLVYDINEERVSQLGSGDRDIIESCLYEKGLGDMLLRNKERISFSAEYADVDAFLDTCDAVFMCLPTPEIGETGESDLSYYDMAAKKLAQSLALRNSGSQEKYIVIVNKSTVPIDMVDRSQEIFEHAEVRNVGFVSNPEFLVEGHAIDGSLKPDRVVVGAWQAKDFDIMRNIYHRFSESPTVAYIEVNPKEAAAGKLLANYYLFMKLAVCFDVVGRVSESYQDISFEHLRNILSSDDRIGTWGLFDSLYAGGSCLTKDARSLAHQLQSAGVDTRLVTEPYDANKRQLELFIRRYEAESGQSWKGKKVALLGTSFKRDTNDVRNSPSEYIVRTLASAGVESIAVHDFAGIKNFQSLVSDVSTCTFSEDVRDALTGVDVCIISTDWPQYRSIAPLVVKEMNTGSVVMDGRRILQHEYDALRHAGFDIIAVGSPFLREQG